MIEIYIWKLHNGSSIIIYITGAQNQAQTLAGGSFPLVAYLSIDGKGFFIKGKSPLSPNASHAADALSQNPKTH